LNIQVHTLEIAPMNRILILFGREKSVHKPDQMIAALAKNVFSGPNRASAFAVARALPSEHEISAIAALDC
jgi:hypothetical protein